MEKVPAPASTLLTLFVDGLGLPAMMPLIVHQVLKASRYVVVFV